MILSHQQIEEIAAAVTKDFNEFFFGKEANDVRIARATPIDQFPMTSHIEVVAKIHRR